MSNAAIKRALTEALLAMPGGLPKAQTQFQNKGFTPVAGQPFQRLTFKFVPPENPTMGDDFKRKRGFMQVTLCWPLGLGEGAAQTVAELIEVAFKRSLSFVANGVTTTIDRTPEIADGRDDGDRWVIPVRVRFYSNIGG